MSKELKPCPFCSHTPMIFNQTGLVVCRYSMCSANPQANSKEDWNKRTTDLLEQENAELREGLQDLLDCKGILTSDKECVIKAKQLLNK